MRIAMRYSHTQLARMLHIIAHLCVPLRESALREQAYGICGNLGRLAAQPVYNSFMLCNAINLIRINTK